MRQIGAHRLITRRLLRRLIIKQRGLYRDGRFAGRRYRWRGIKIGRFSTWGRDFTVAARACGRGNRGGGDVFDCGDGLAKFAWFGQFAHQLAGALDEVKPQPLSTVADFFHQFQPRHLQHHRQTHQHQQHADDDATGAAHAVFQEGYDGLPPKSTRAQRQAVLQIA